MLEGPMGINRMEQSSNYIDIFLPSASPFHDLISLHFASDENCRIVVLLLLLEYLSIDSASYQRKPQTGIKTRKIFTTESLDITWKKQIRSDIINKLHFFFQSLFTCKIVIEGFLAAGGTTRLYNKEGKSDEPHI